MSARSLDVGAAAIAGAFACAMVGLVALATSGPVGPMPLVVLGVAVLLGASRFVLRRAPVAAEAASLRTGLGVFLIAIVVVPAHAIASGSWMLGAVDLLVLLQASRLLALRSATKPVVGQVLVIALLMLMAAAVLTINFAFLGSVFLFCVAGTWTAMFHTLWDPAARGTDARVPRSVAGVALAAGMAVFALTGVFFAVLPRIQFQAFQSGFLQLQGVSGFSEEVQLGDIGSTKRDTTPVMRVTLSGKPVPPDRLYWRGMSLDHYDGAGRWRVRDAEETELQGRPTSRGPTPRLQYLLGPPADDLVLQDVVFEPLDVSVIFGLATMQSIEGDMRLLTRNTTDAVFFRASRFGRMRYSVRSDVRAPIASDIRDEALADVRESYYQIPPELKARLEPLARELAGEGSAWRKARRIETALQTWDYSLEPPRGSRADPVESFLLETRSGWCEQYSSGMVLLLRSLGIPARMTNGFSGGEFNEFGRYWLVRNSDAHSWVEVPFADSGWVIFDPTPGQGPPTPPFGRGLRRGFDYLRLLWTQRVVEYGLLDQFEIVRAASRRAESLGQQLSGIGERSLSAARPLAVAAAGIAALATALLVALRRRSRWPKDPAARAAAEATRWWKLVERRFRRNGIIRRAGETPRELAVRAGEPGWADLYYVARFGMRPLTDEERAEIERIRATVK